MFTKIASAALVSIGVVAVLPAAAAQAAQTATERGFVTGQPTSTFACLNDSSLSATAYITVRAHTPEELEGPDAKLIGAGASNPCSHVISMTVGVRKRNGDVIDLAVNVEPGHSFTATKKDIRHYGIGRRYTFINSFGSGTSAAVAGPTVIVVATI